MQDLHGTVGDGGGCSAAPDGGHFFGVAGGDRRFRPQNHLNHQALKCPRCDSLNTKFCYYNNYNLSQPRHFCKGCRRYWTKGGVLRSVPVGGGCRKTKRSKPKSGANPDAVKERKSKSQSPSSTESSSTLTAATPTAVTAAAVVVADEGSTLSGKPSSDSGSKYNFSDVEFFGMNPNFSSSADGQIFSGMDDFNGATMIGFSINQQQENLNSGGPEVTLEGISEVEEFKVQNVDDDLDWGSSGGGGGDQGLYDLTAALDPAYWSQPQWTDNDHPLNNYLPKSHCFNPRWRYH